MEIKLDSESLATVAANAIFQEMDQATRDEVLKQAVKGLLTPSTSTWNRGKTPLQEAFDQALNNAARIAVEKTIRDDPVVSSHIHELLGPLVNSALEAEGVNYDSTLATKIGQAVGQWLAECAQARRD